MSNVTYMKDDKLFSYKEIVEKDAMYPTGLLKAVCFAGHCTNKLCGCDYEEIISKVAHEVLQLYKLGYRKFINGGAQGFDQLAFRAVKKVKCKYKIKNIINSVYVPFVGQESCWSETGEFSKQEWYNMLDAADEVRIVNDKILPSNPHYDIARALDELNKAMLRDSSILVAWYKNGSEGYTLSCIKEALMLGMEVINLCDTD